MRLLAVLLLGLCVGCSPPKPAPTYRVALIRPDGQRHYQWLVKSHGMPISYATWSGQSQLLTMDRLGRYERSPLGAPVGWALIITGPE